MELKTYIGEKMASSTNDAGKTGSLHVQTETRLLFSPYSKVNLESIKDLNFNHETLKLL
jgi:hypothetical protein